MKCSGLSIGITLRLCLYPVLLAFSWTVCAREILLDALDNPQDIRLHNMDITTANISDIHMDKYGFICVTSFQGLIRFEGNETTVFKNDNSLTSLPQRHSNSLPLEI